MAQSSSKGTFGLPHYRNSRASMENYEPVYKNLFTVELTLPAAVGATSEEVNLLLEEVSAIHGLDTHKMPGVVEQQYKFATRSYAASKPSNTTLDLTIDFQVNLQSTTGNAQPSPYAAKTLRKWCDLVYDPLTGRMGLKEDYIAPSGIITLYNKANQPFWQWKLYSLIPLGVINIGDMEYNNGEAIYSISGFKMRCDYWDEQMV